MLSQHARLAAAVIVKDILRDNPAMTTGELVRRLDEIADEAEAEQVEMLRRERAECRNCGQKISRPVGGDVDMWRHEDADRSRSCRAASFDDETGWDDSLKRTWMARPRP